MKTIIKNTTKWCAMKRNIYIIAALVAVASMTLLTGRSSKTVWMNDKAKHDPGDLHDPDWKNVFTFAETNTVELGLRSDGTVVWRKYK